MEEKEKKEEEKMRKALHVSSMTALMASLIIKTRLLFILQKSPAYNMSSFLRRVTRKQFGKSCFLLLSWLWSHWR